MKTMTEYMMNSNTSLNIARMMSPLNEIDPLLIEKLFVEGNTVGQIVEVHGGYLYQYLDIETQDVVTVGPLCSIDVLNRTRENQITALATKLFKGELLYNASEHTMVDIGYKILMN